MSLYEELIEADIARARERQPPELRNRFCRICGPFMMTCCPAAPKHDLRPIEKPKLRLVK